MQFPKFLPTLLFFAALCVPYVETNQVNRGSGETNQDESDFEVEMFKRRFVNALHRRVERALIDERKQYDDQLAAIYAREEELKQKLAETQEQKKRTEQKLYLKKGEEKELSNKLFKVSSDAEKAQINERLAAVSKERTEADALIAKLTSDERAIKETLDFRKGWIFASKGRLKKERDRINDEWLKITYKRIDWEASYSPEQFSAFKNLLKKTAEAAALICNVVIISENDSGETTGASIKYQTSDQRLFGARPKPAKCSTRCLEQLSPELYYVWTERHDKPTSDINAKFSIISENDKITLKEYPNK